MFVDASGRRARVIRRAGMAVAGACAGYAVLLGVAFAGGTPFAPATLIPGVEAREGASARAEPDGRNRAVPAHPASTPGSGHVPGPAARPGGGPTVVAAAKVAPSATRGRAAASLAPPADAPGETAATATAGASPRPGPPRTPAATPTAAPTPSASASATPVPDGLAFPPRDAGGDLVPGTGWDS